MHLREGKSVREIGFHSRFRCQVLAIRRKGATLTTGFADEPLRFGDVLLACGAWEHILQLRDHRHQYILLHLPQDSHEVIPPRSRGPLAVLTLAPMAGVLVFDLLPGGANLTVFLSPVRTIIFGLLIIGFLVFEPHGLAEVWRRIRRFFHLWPFRN